jgi:hypothetical protein
MGNRASAKLGGWIVELGRYIEYLFEPKINRCEIGFGGLCTETELGFQRGEAGVIVI